MTSFTHPVVHAVPAGAIVSIAVASIKASDTNPRRTFDGIEELAESIKASGLLQPLVVRPNGKAGSYELIAGERRWRALKLAKIETAQCKVLNVDAGQAMADQIVENLQRQDLGPLEEAEQFKALQDQDPKKWTPQAIAKTVGKTDRFVQQRLAIAGGLSAPLKKKFAAGELSVEAARTLAPLPASIQAQVPSWAIESGNAGDIRRQAFSLCIPDRVARFDLALYTGAWITDDKAQRYFADVAQFRRLQKPAAEKKLAEVQKEWPKAQLVSPDDAAKFEWADSQYVYSHNRGVAGSQRDGDQPAKYFVPKDKCTAIVWIADNGEIRKALGVCSAAAINAVSKQRQAATSARYKSPAGEKKDHKAARVAFNAAIAKAARAKPDMASRLMLFNLVTDQVGESTKKLLPKSLQDLAGAWPNEPTLVKLWTAIADLRAAEVGVAVTKVLLATLPTWEAHEHNQKPRLQVAMAQSLGVKVPAIALPPVKVKDDDKAKAKKAVRK